MALPTDPRADPDDLEQVRISRRLEALEATAKRTADAAIEAAKAAREARSAAVFAVKRADEHAIAMNARFDSLAKVVADSHAIIAREFAETREAIKGAVELAARTAGSVQEVREKAPSKHDLERLEERVDEIEEEVTSPGRTIPSDRVRELAAGAAEGVLTKAQLEEFRETERLRRKTRYAVAATVIAAAIVGAGAFAWHAAAVAEASHGAPTAPAH